MAPRLTRSVELPARHNRPLLAAAGLAVLFACGAHNYMMSSARARARTVELSFATAPPGAEVVRERDGEILCRTPCRVVHEVGRFGATAFRFVADGYEDRQVVVNLGGGDTRVEAVLSPR
jgi:hypothetical protein